MDGPHCVRPFIYLQTRARPPWAVAVMLPWAQCTDVSPVPFALWGALRSGVLGHLAVLFLCFEEQPLFSPVLLPLWPCPRGPDPGFLSRAGSKGTGRRCPGTSRRPRPELPAPGKMVNAQSRGPASCSGGSRSGAAWRGGSVLLWRMCVEEWVGGAEAGITGLPDPGPRLRASIPGWASRCCCWGRKVLQGAHWAPVTEFLNCGAPACGRKGG